MNFNLAGFNRKGQALLCPHFEAESNSFFYVFKCFFLGGTLADTARDGGTFNDPDTIFIAVEAHN